MLLDDDVTVEVWGAVVRQQPPIGMLVWFHTLGGPRLGGKVVAFVQSALFVSRCRRRL